MMLSILICHLPDRAALLSRLLQKLAPQCGGLAEILIETDHRKQSTGVKRNRLLHRSSGQYVCFVDDDDLVSDDYVVKIITAIQTHPDCCGMEGLMMKDGKNPRRFIHSLRYKEWCEKDGVYLRFPNHLNPVKRHLAIEAGYPDVVKGEDFEYSKRLLPLLKTEVYIKGAIYYYLTGTPIFISESIKESKNVQ